jgi:hypothetical protein
MQSATPECRAKCLTLFSPLRAARGRLYFVSAINYPHKLAIDSNNDGVKYYFLPLVLDLHFNHAAMIAFGHLAGAQRNKGNYFTAS